MEDIKEIAVSIKNHHDRELDKHAANIAIGRALAELDNKKKIYWLINREYYQSTQNVVNIHGETIRTVPGNLDTLSDDGPTVYKNTKLGEILIKHFEGNHPYRVKDKIISLSIYNRASFASEFGGSIINVKINIAGEKVTYQYKNITELLAIIQLLESEIDEEKKKVADLQSEKEKKEHLELLKKRTKELEEIKAKTQYFIRQQVALRNQHILDPQQEDIKRSNIFENTLIINGGPGTGKTTALVQRIMFLTASSILEYKPELSKDQVDLLSSNDSWIFFSPSELLRLYLKNNMTGEGLKAGDDKVKVWRTYINELCRRYKLFNSETRRPFLDLNKETEYFDQNVGNIKKLSDEFDKFFFDYQKEKIRAVIAVETKNFGWKFLAIGIKEGIAKKESLESWKDWISLYHRLNNQFKDRVNDLTNDYKDLVDKIANEILLEIKTDVTLLNDVYGLLERLLENNTNNFSIEEDNEDEAVDFEESESISLEKEIELFKRLKLICRKFALLQFDKQIKFTKDELELIKLVPTIESSKGYDKLGELAYFIKNFVRIVNGPVANIFSEIAKIYKLFRKEKIDNYLTLEGRATLAGILKDKNRRIHEEEQTFLLYKINQIIRLLYSTDRDTFINSNNSFISAFRDCSRAIIAIDEATDFSALDIITMRSLSHPLISAVTLSGDLMQRITKKGIRDWIELSELIQDIDIRNLDVSYRQSQTLLEVAKTIYIGELGVGSNYSAFAKKNENEPKPLSFFSSNEKTKISWIADRIIEIYNSYGNSIPSIAIFLSKDFEEFTKELNSSEVLSDVGIKVVLCRDGQILGDENTIRVFPVEFIKGLEFEAVFFHNVDSLDESELLLRFFYVGLSRATFYLAITGNSNLPKSITPIGNLFHQGNWKN